MLGGLEVVLAGKGSCRRCDCSFLWFGGGDGQKTCFGRDRRIFWCFGV